MRAGTAEPFWRWDRIAAGTAVAAIHVLIALALTLGMRVALSPPVAHERPTLIVIEPTPLPKPPPQPPPPKPKAQGGAPSPRKARPLPKIASAPPPVVPAPPPLIAVPSPVPAGGGADNGEGQGGGTGGEGTGSGAGQGEGDGADFTEARQIGGRFRNSDFPDSVRLVGRVRIGVRFAVTPTGAVDQCEIIEPSGYPEVDAMTCRVITERYRFKPARDGDGIAVTEVMEERYTWKIR